MRADPPGPLPEVARGPLPSPGQPAELAEGVLRLTAPNPGLMTGPGTNTYLVGRGRLAVIDPGPDDAGHRGAILAAAQGRGSIDWILVTHTHPDHAPGAGALAAATGALQVGFEAREGFCPDRSASDGWSLGEVGPLRAVHTPGHAGDHLCWLLEEERLLFSGDHVMQGSTVVIRPPDGDMIAYLASLGRLLELDPPLVAIAPGHGRLIGDPQRAVAALLEHRHQRERLVESALGRRRRATVAELLPEVYADVGAERLAVARCSLWAHLRKLRAEGRVALECEPGEDELEGGSWVALRPAERS